MSVGEGISRRRFLALTTVSAIGCGAVCAPKPVSAVSAARVVGANETVRIGVIGCGRRGIALIRAILKRQRAGSKVKLAAVCDIYEPRKARARALTQADLHHRWQGLVDRNDIDAIIVATPDHWHAPMAVAAMECGKDVYCETPMARRVDEAKAFRDCAARTRRVVQIGAQQTSEGQWHTARDILRAGRIGRPVWSQGSYSTHASDTWTSPIPAKVRPDNLDWPAFLGDAPKRSFSPERYARWRAYWDYSGGLATDLFYPKLAALLLALGPAFPQRVSAAGGVYARDGREVPDSFVMTCQYSSGNTVVLASAMAHGNRFPAIIRGEQATLEFLGETVRITDEADCVKPVKVRFGRDRTARIPTMGRPGHMDNWLEGIRTRQRCACDEESGYRAMVAIGMAVEAYRQGKTLYFDAGKEEVTVRPQTSLRAPRPHARVLIV